jgi:hypothetical protein
MNTKEKEEDVTTKSHWYWITSIVILIIAILGLFYLFFFSPYSEDIDSNIFVVALTALIGLLGVTFQIIASKQSDAERCLHEIKINHHNTISQIKMKGYEARKKIYDQLLKPFTNIIIATCKKEKINIEKTMGGIIKAGIDIHLLGSDETCKIWDEWRAFSFKAEHDKELDNIVGLITLALYPKLVLSIRRDLGHPYTEISEIDVFRSFIKDIDKYKDVLQIIVKSETLEDALKTKI